MFSSTHASEIMCELYLKKLRIDLRVILYSYQIALTPVKGDNLNILVFMTFSKKIIFTLCQ